MPAQVPCRRRQGSTIIQAWDLFVDASQLLIGYNVIIGSDSTLAVCSVPSSSFANNGVSVLYILACMEFSKRFSL